jgi:Leucine-rich repeat (LRR) protein
LFFVDISHNQLQALPQSIGGLQEINEFLLDDNKLMEFPLSIGNLKKLCILGLRDNPMKVWPEGLLGCENLVLFYRDGTYIYVDPETRKKIDERMQRLRI